MSGPSQNGKTKQKSKSMSGTAGPVNAPRDSAMAADDPAAPLRRGF